MTYKVSISVKESRMGSIPLKTKKQVSEWIKRNPMGNYKTKVQVENTSTGKSLTESKIHFYNPKRWKI